MRISAKFETIDEAELCARTLKQSGEDIRAVRIRQRMPVQEQQEEGIGDPPVQVIPYALYNGYGGGTGESGNAAVPFAGVFDTDFQGDVRQEDGPEGRQDCRMDVLTLDEYPARIEQIIRNGHGREISRYQL